MSTVEEQAKLAAALKEMKEYHETMATLCGSELAKLGTPLCQQMVNTSVDNMRIGGALFNDGAARIVTPKITYKPSVKNELKLFEWVRSMGLGDMIKETIHYKKLESFVDCQKEANQPLPPPDVMDVFTMETVSVRRAPSSKK